MICIKKDEELEVLFKEKQIFLENINNLNCEVERRAENSGLIEEFKTKLRGFTEMNSQLNEEFIQLQQRFNAQKEIVTQKNAEISELIGKLQSLEAEREELIEIVEENNKKINQKHKEHEYVKNQVMYLY
jgi:chromosome segregation ATPase